MTTPTSFASPSTDSQAPRPLPVWASVPIILVCLAGGGWILHWYVGTHLAAADAHVLGDVPARPAAAARGGTNRGGGGWAGLFGGGGGTRNVQARGQENNRERFEAFTEHGQAWFVVPAGKPPTLSVLTYGAESAYAFVPDEARRTIFTAHRLASDRTAVEALKLTPDQSRQLQQRSRLAMTASVADRSLLTADFTALRAAAGRDRPAAQAKLLSDLDDVAARSEAGTAKAMADNAARINAAVTPEQWKQYQTMGGRP